MKKAKSIKVHARRRAVSRFGIKLGPKLHDDFVALIKQRKASFVERQSNRVTVWDIVHEGEVVRLVYDTERKLIVTLLDHSRPGQKPTALRITQANPTI